MKVFFLLLVYVFNLDLSEFLAAILEKGLLRLNLLVLLAVVIPFTYFYINPLTPGAFCKNAFFGHFDGFEAKSRPN